MSPIKISASLTLPINTMVAFQLEGGVFEWHLLAGVQYLHWCRLHAWSRCCGEVLLCPPWEFKGLEIQALRHSWHIWPHPWNYSIESDFSHFPFWSGFGCFWPYHYFDCCLATGTFDYLCWCSDYSSFDPYWNPVAGFFWCTLSPFNSCHQLLLHFDPLKPGSLYRSLGVLVVISSLFEQCITDSTQFGSLWGVMLFFLMLTFSFSRHSHQSHVII